MNLMLDQYMKKFLNHGLLKLVEKSKTMKDSAKTLRLESLANKFDVGKSSEGDLIKLNKKQAKDVSTYLSGVILSLQSHSIPAYRERIEKYPNQSHIYEEYIKRAEDTVQRAHKTLQKILKKLEFNRKRRKK